MTIIKPKKLALAVAGCLFIYAPLSLAVDLIKITPNKKLTTKNLDEKDVVVATIEYSDLEIPVSITGGGSTFDSTGLICLKEKTDNNLDISKDGNTITIKRKAANNKVSIDNKINVAYCSPGEKKDDDGNIIYVAKTIDGAPTCQLSNGFNVTSGLPVINNQGQGLPTQIEFTPKSVKCGSMTAKAGSSTSPKTVTLGKLQKDNIKLPTDYAFVDNKTKTQIRYTKTLKNLGYGEKKVTLTGKYLDNIKESSTEKTLTFTVPSDSSGEPDPGKTYDKKDRYIKLSAKNGGVLAKSASDYGCVWDRGEDLNNPSDDLIWEIKQDYGIHHREYSYRWWIGESSGGGYGLNGPASPYCNAYLKSGTNKVNCDSYSFVQRANKDGWCGIGDSGTLSKGKWRLPHKEELRTTARTAKTTKAEGVNVPGLYVKPIFKNTQNKPGEGTGSGLDVGLYLSADLKSGGYSAYLWRYDRLPPAAGQYYAVGTGAFNLLRIVHTPGTELITTLKNKLQ